MIYTVTTEPKEINFSPNLVEEILQNVYTVLTTLELTVPLDREFGINGVFIDDPTIIARAQLTAEIFEKVPAFEDRVTVEEVEYREDPENGKLYPVVVIRINEGVL